MRAAAAQGKSSTVVPRDAWFDVRSGQVVVDAVPMLAKSRVVLLGERHDDPAHHRWQLNTLKVLLGLRGDLVLGFEMFPRRVQASLDRWSSGELSPTAFLNEVDWQRVWRFDPQLYLPLFELARASRIPMLALNVDRETNRRAAAGETDRDVLEGVGWPAPASAGYRDRLLGWFARHPMGDAGAAIDPARFERFVRAQLFWDRAMAEAIFARVGGEGSPLVVGVMGRGHIEYGDGVPRQLASLGIDRVVTALPWPADNEAPLTNGLIADYLFGAAP